MVKVENISKRYGDHYAVKDLSFEIEKGQVYGFLGPNGAGKSTTMNIMTGYIAASEGSVEINGHDILKDAEEAKKCIGYLPELPPLYMDMTVKEYLTFAAELKGVAKAVRKTQIEEVMEKTFITDMANRLIKNLSKGYKQRVGLAQAMLGNPDIIILDEPTVGLDPKQINEIRDLIRSLKEDHAVILSSHILSEVAEVCDQLIIVAKGHKIASGTLEEIFGMLEEKNTIEITASGSKEGVESALKDNAMIKSITFEDCDEALVKCKIEVDGNEDIRIEISKLLATNGIAILNMDVNKDSLEDMFLKLTEDAYVDEFIKLSEAKEETSEEKNEKAIVEETVKENDADESTVEEPANEDVKEEE